MGNSAGQTDGSGTPLEWHKHNNLSLLQRFTTDNDGYLYLAAAPTSDKPNEGAEAYHLDGQLRRSDRRQWHTIRVA